MKKMSGSPFGDLMREAIQAPKGTVLMRQGEIGRCAFFVVQGRLLVEKEINGDNLVLGEIGPRDIVGEIAILDDAPRSATVTAIEDSLLVKLDKQRIKMIISRSPAVAEVIMKLLCFKLRQNHDFLNKGTDLRSPECWRKICTILQLCSRGNYQPEELFFTVLGSLQLLIGFSSHHLHEVLVRLDESDVIELEGNQIKAIDDNKLDLFLIHSKEEYSNEEFDQPTQAKFYQVVQLIQSNCNLGTQEGDWIEIPKEILFDLFLSSNLWAELRPAVQQNRVESTMKFMITLEVMFEKEEADNTLVIDLNKLSQFEVPTDTIMTYESMKSCFFKPLSKS